MKRIAVICLALLSVCAALSAQATETIQEKEKIYTIDIEYIPDLREAKITYTCPTALYKENEAITAIKNRLILFTKEKGYFHYSYYQRDEVVTDSKNKTTSYTSFVKFSY